MPWGKGSIDRKMADGLRCQDRQTGLDASANDTQIFYNLGMDRVHYVPQNAVLYFVQSEHFEVLETITKVYLGLGKQAPIRQLFLDQHGYYKGALRLTISTHEARTVLAALRLKNVKISIAKDTPNKK